MRTARQWFMGGSKRDDEVKTPNTKLAETAARLKALQQKMQSETKQPTSTMGQVLLEIREVLFGHKLNILLLLMPLALVSAAREWQPAVTFLLALLPLCSLAERLGFVTEQLATYMNETISGLLNASFGNATELIVAGFALYKSMVRLVQLSLLGSVISNLLLVLGCAFLAGGLKHPMQQFNQKGVNVHCALLLLGCAAVLLPSALSETKTLKGDEDEVLFMDPHASSPPPGPGPHVRTKAVEHELALSRFDAVVMLLLYAAYLLFQLCTHRHLFEADEENQQGASQHSGSYSGFVKLSKKDSDMSGEGTQLQMLETRSGEHRKTAEDASQPGTPDSARAMLFPRDSSGPAKAGGSDDDEEDEQVLSLWGSITWLALLTVFIALMSEPLTNTIEKASLQLRIGKQFMYTIVLPIVGNAAEHTSAIIFAMKNKMELALGVAVGSATQILVLVVPLCVVLGWIMGVELDLDFNTFEALTLFIGVLLAVIVVQDGNSHWLKGVVLVVTYLFTGAAFWNHYDERINSEV